jgi:hypothetical protein
MSSGHEVSLHHTQCRICTTVRDVAVELSRQDYPAEHTLARILSHKGTLLDRSSLTFEAIFADGDIRWLSWPAVSSTAALHEYANQFQCTRLLLAEDLPAIQSRLTTPRLTDSRSVEGIPIPAINDVTYVTLFAFPAALDTEVARQDIEFCLHATVVKITPKRIDLTFTVIPGLRVAWSLLKYAAFCSASLSASQRVLSQDMLGMFSGLRQALGA